MQIEDFASGSIRIDGLTYEYDVVIEGGEIRNREKKPSKKFLDDFGHTPLSMEEDIPWKCRRLVIGTGAHGKLPRRMEVRREAERRKVEPLIVPTSAAVEELPPILYTAGTLLIDLLFSYYGGQIAIRKTNSATRRLLLASILYVPLLFFFMMFKTT